MVAGKFADGGSEGEIRANAPQKVSLSSLNCPQISPSVSLASVWQRVGYHVANYGMPSFWRKKNRGPHYPVRKGTNVAATFGRRSSEPGPSVQVTESVGEAVNTLKEETHIYDMRESSSMSF